MLTLLRCISLDVVLSINPRPKHVVRTLIVIIQANIVVFDCMYYYTKLLTIVFPYDGCEEGTGYEIPITLLLCNEVCCFFRYTKCYNCWGYLRMGC